VHALREAVERDGVSPDAPFDALRAASPSPQVLQDLTYAANDDVDTQRWGSAGKVGVLHPFGPIGFPFLDGATMPGDGDEYTVRVQTNDLTQSFRAVWEAGDWENGGVSIPSGESGEIGSSHYDDLAEAWIRGRMESLPFSDDAVRRATRETLLLSPM
jgi:acyl-homoserine lactone acylase PvdQ